MLGKRTNTTSCEVSAFQGHLVCCIGKEFIGKKEEKTRKDCDVLNTSTRLLVIIGVLKFTTSKIPGCTYISVWFVLSLSPGGRFPPSFIHQVIITGLNKLQLYVLPLKMALDADRA